MGEHWVNGELVARGEAHAVRVVGVAGPCRSISNFLIANASRAVIEIRVHAEGEYRVIVAARFTEAVFVLHAFVKKSRKTPVPDLTLARKRFRDLSTERARDE